MSEGSGKGLISVLVFVCESEEIVMNRVLYNIDKHCRLPPRSL